MQLFHQSCHDSSYLGDHPLWGCYQRKFTSQQENQFQTFSVVSKFLLNPNIHPNLMDWLYLTFIYLKKVKVLVAQSYPTLWDSQWTIATRLLLSMEFSREEYCCHSFLQKIFLTQGSNPGLLHCRQILYHLSPFYLSKKAKFSQKSKVWMSPRTFKIIDLRFQSCESPNGTCFFLTQAIPW